MNIIERVGKILIAPKSEWPVIDSENLPYMKVLTDYLIILALIPAIASFIGGSILGASNTGLGISIAIRQFASIIIGACFTAWIISIVAPAFGARKEFDKAFSLVAYSYTAICVAGVFYIFLPLSTPALLASLYSLYLLYIGLKPMMKVPDEKVTAYFIVSLLVMVIVLAILSALFGAMFIVGAASSAALSL